MNGAQQSKIVMTPRDKEIIRAVKATRCLTLDQLNQLTDFPKRSLSNRLRDLTKAGYLSKLEYGRIGGVYLAAWTTGSYFGKAWLPPFATKSLPELQHQLELNQIFVDLNRYIPSFRDDFFWSDSLGNMPFRLQANPDASVSRRNDDRMLLIEYDRSNKGLNRIEENIGRYQDYLLGSHCSQPTHLLYVAKTPERAQNIQHKVKRFLSDPKLFESVTTAEALDRIAAWFGVGIATSDGPRLTQDDSSVTIAKSKLECARQFVQAAHRLYIEKGVPIPDCYLETMELFEQVQRP